MTDPTPTDTEHDPVLAELLAAQPNRAARRAILKRYGLIDHRNDRDRKCADPA